MIKSCAWSAHAELGNRLQVFHIADTDQGKDVRHEVPVGSAAVASQAMPYEAGQKGAESSRINLRKDSTRTMTLDISFHLLMLMVATATPSKGIQNPTGKLWKKLIAFFIGR